MIAIIVLAALVNEVPLMLFQSSVSLKLSQQSRLCIRLYAPLIEQVPFGSELMKVKFEQLISCSVPFPYLSVIKMYPMIFCI